MDFAALGTAVVSNLNSALGAATAPAALVIGAIAGYSLFRRFVG